jgi:hypothetical protein
VKARLKIALVILASVLAIYVGSYCRLSSQGEYRDSLKNDILYVVWVPKGYSGDNRINPAVKFIFKPLLWLDHRVWHTSEAAYQG